MSHSLSQKSSLRRCVRLHIGRLPFYTQRPFKPDYTVQGLKRMSLHFMIALLLKLDLPGVVTAMVVNLVAGVVGTAVAAR